MGNKPTAAFVLSLIGGIFVFLVGVWLAILGAILASFGFGNSGLFDIGLVVGLVIIVISVLLWIKPEMKLIWGILLIVLALVSIPTALGGFGLGFILTLVGGILALTFKPTMMAPPMMAPPMGQPMGAPMPMNCPACGSAINPATRTCTGCGRPV